MAFIFDSLPSRVQNVERASGGKHRLIVAQHRHDYETTDNKTNSPL